MLSRSNQTLCLAFAFTTFFLLANLTVVASVGDCEDKLCQTCEQGTCSECFDHSSFNVDGKCICNRGYQYSKYSMSCECADGYYYNLKTAICARCHETCETCTGPKSTDCTGCKTAYEVLDEKTGVCKCEKGTFKSLGGVKSVCVPCHVSCEACKGPGNYQCTSCDIAKTTLVEGQCQCPESYFIDLTELKCKKCHEDCLQCKGAEQHECLTCKHPLFKPSTSGICGCPLTSYFDGDQCKNCASNCEVCTGPNIEDCKQCKLGYDLNNQTHKCECGKGTFKSKDTEDHCSMCSKLCSECAGTHSDQCISCGTNAVFTPNPKPTPPSEQNSTNSTANSTQTPDASGTNGTASSNGTSEANSTAASNSSSEGTIDPNAPVLGSCECQSGYWPNPSRFSQNHSISSPTLQDSCLACQSDCVECDHLGVCKTCRSGYRISNGVCVCDYGYFINVETGSCEKCDDGCKECLQTADHCTKCANYSIPAINGKCGCPDGTYADNSGLSRQCQLCHENCLTCYGPSDSECLLCPQWNKEFNHALKICQCKRGYYEDSESGLCKECHFTCIDCVGPLTSQCLSCRGTSILIPVDISDTHGEIGFCTCPEGHFPIGNGACQTCHPSCKTCSGPTNSECLSCDEKIKVLSEDHQCIWEMLNR